MNIKQLRKKVKNQVKKTTWEVSKKIAKRTLPARTQAALKTAWDEYKMREARKELTRVEQLYKGTDREHVWAFISGHTSQDFRGNPKYLFVYINRYRPDIKAYWLCSRQATLDQVRSLGFEAYKLESSAAQYVINRTGVLVVEQVKYAMPEGFENVKYINLWHGVGFKNIERRQFMGDIAMDLARKYVRQGTFYRDHQLMTVTNPVIEQEYTGDCGIDYDKFLRTGYTRCLYQQNFDPIVSFDHDLLKIKGLPEDTRIAVYAPTFRAKLGNTFSEAITDIEALYEHCEKNHILFIFKVHPNMEKEVGFLKAWKMYGDRPWFWFWDNQEDFYEVMHKCDLAIVDYSGIISDMVAVGIRHYIRYIFDVDEYMESIDTHGNYFEKSTGKIVKTFDELLEVLDHYEDFEDPADVARLNEDLWSYSSGKDDFEKIINTAFNFTIQERTFPDLHSFDIFDTLFSRKVLHPHGIFYYVKERMEEEGGFPDILTRKYPFIRHTAEFAVREYYVKSQDLRDSDHVEISFDDIFERIQNVYGLSDGQIEKLKAWEMEAELDNILPLPAQIDKVKSLLAAGEKVILISDMYLPKEFVQRMLEKADPVLATLPLYLSSDYGVLKTSQKLFFEVYKSFEPYYDFRKWYHYGDNINADETQPRKFMISTRRIRRPAFNLIQQELVKNLGTSDGYLVAAMQARLCFDNTYKQDEFAISYIALCFVPYIDWVLRDAMRRGYETLYFISRDGYHLKRIADEIIRVRGLSFKTKYIYASRRTWRVPSFVHEVDPGFWEPYGSFTDIASKQKLFSAMDLDEETFREIFPEIDPDQINFRNKKEVAGLKQIFRNSEKFNSYLLETAAKERVIVNEYLLQEIDPSEKFAMVEYYGRGYSQDCLINLWRDAIGDDTAGVPFYYSRSVLPSLNGAERHHFTTNNTKQYFIEGIFANMPYKSIQEYAYEDGKVVPVIEPISYDKDLYDSMNRLLPEFAAAYAALDLKHPEDTDRMLYDFVFDYYLDNRDNPEFVNIIGKLVDSVTLYGNKREFAPPYTMDTLDRFERKTGRGAMAITSDITMSVVRSEPKVRKRYEEMYQILPGDRLDSGRLLSVRERGDNARFRKMYEKLDESSDAFAELYAKAAEENEVQKKVLLVTEGRSIQDKSLELIKRALEKRSDFRVETVLLGRRLPMSHASLAKKLATARYILVNEPVGLFAKIHFREESELILLPERVFILYNQGPASTPFLKWSKKYKQLSGSNDFSQIQIPSEALQSVFHRDYSTSSRVKYELQGGCYTDLYHNESWKKRATERLLAAFPEAKGRKIILYMPSWRTRKSYKKWAYMLDLEQLHDMIGDDYAVVVNRNRSEIKTHTLNRINIPGFSKELSGSIPVRELMAAADIIIGDYRDAFFESALLHKPVFSTATDYEDIIRFANMSMNRNSFEDYLFCPLVRSSLDLAKELEQIDTYDYGPVEAFREKYFSWCDGHSTERVVKYLLNKES